MGRFYFFFSDEYAFYPVFQPPSRVCWGAGALRVPSEQPGGGHQPLPGRAHQDGHHTRQWHAPAHPLPLGQGTWAHSVGPHPCSSQPQRPILRGTLPPRHYPEQITAPEGWLYSLPRVSGEMRTRLHASKPATHCSPSPWASQGSLLLSPGNPLTGVRSI